MERDVVCGMQVDPANAAGTSDHNGKTYSFCSKACKTKFDDMTESFSMFRVGGTDPVVYVRQGENWTKHLVKDKKVLDALLPQWFEIDSKVALPQSVPIKYLAEAERSLRTGVAVTLPLAA